MRLVLSSYDDIANPYYGGGGAVAVQKVANYLSKKHDVLVITANYPGAKKGKVNGVKYERIGLSFLGARTGQLVYQFLLPFKMLFTEFDIWFESFTPPFSVSVLPLISKKPVIGLVHMLTAEDMKRKYKLPFDTIERIGLKFYRYFITTTDVFAQKIKKVNPEAVVKTIPNGIDIPKAKTSKKKHILFMGRLEVDQKGLDLLLQAMSFLKGKDPPQLVIAGSGSSGDVEKLKKIIVKLGLKKSVSLVDKISGKEKERYLRGAYFMVVPSRFETFSIAALEAISYSLPVVCFDIDGLKWLPERTSLKAEPFDTKELSGKILKLLQDKKFRVSMGAYGSEYSQNFSWDKVGKKYSGLLKIFEDSGNKSKSYLSQQTQGFEKLTKQIISKKPICLFVSPHLDDAIFSAGSLMRYLTDNKVEVKVLNIFTKADIPPYTLSAKSYHRQCGYSDAKSLYRQRVIEDKIALSKLGIRPINMGKTEALYRKNSEGFMANTFGKLIPEVNYLYPVYRLHIQNGNIALEDQKLIKKIKEKITQVISGYENYIIFAPMAVGGHVDHQLVKKACSEYKNTVFWNDIPYTPGKEVKKAIKDMKVTKYYSNLNGFSDKAKLIEKYVSQKQVFSDITKFKEEAFFINSNIEFK